MRVAAARRRPLPLWLQRRNTVGMANLEALLRDERLALVELLETLSPEQWASPSLCHRWTVQDVAAHLAFVSVMPPHRVGLALVSAGMRVNKMIADTAIRDSRRGVPAILDQMRSNAETGAKPLGVPRLAPLADAVVHQLDIRVPLNEPRQIPAAAFRRVAPFFAKTRFPESVVVGGNVRKRVAGLRLAAEDVEWSYGEGPEVRGPAQSLILMLAGRPFGADDLTGPGAVELYSRL